MKYQLCVLVVAAVSVASCAWYNIQPKPEPFRAAGTTARLSVALLPMDAETDLGDLQDIAKVFDEAHLFDKIHFPRL